MLDSFKKRKAQYMAVDHEGRDVYLADSAYVLTMARKIFRRYNSTLHPNFNRLVTGIRRAASVTFLRFLRLIIEL